MGIRNTTSPYGGGSILTDHFVGKAFPFVRLVAENMELIKYMATHLPELRPKDVEFQFDAVSGYLQWRYVGDTTWTNLVQFLNMSEEEIAALVAEMEQLRTDLAPVSALAPDLVVVGTNGEMRNNGFLVGPAYLGTKTQAEINAINSANPSSMYPRGSLLIRDTDSLVHQFSGNAFRPLAHVNEQGRLVDGNGQPLALAVIVQDARSSNFTLETDDSSTRIPVQGDVDVTLDVDSNITAFTEVRRKGPGDLALIVGPGVSAIDPVTGLESAPLLVQNNLASIVVEPGFAENEYLVYTTGA